MNDIDLADVHDKLVEKYPNLVHVVLGDGHEEFDNDCFDELQKLCLEFSKHLTKRDDNEK